MSKFNINIAKLAIQLLPMCLRGGKMKGFIKSCAEPLKYTGDFFEDYRAEQDYRITHNGQVCYLKAVLNDKFDPLLRGITIQDGDGDFDGVIIKERSEDEPLIIAKRVSETPTTVFKRNFGGSRSVSFRVKLPLRLRTDLYDVNATVNKYKVAGMRYEVIQN